MVFFKNIRKFMVLLIPPILTFALVGCGMDQGKKEIYENEHRIAQEGDSYSFFRRIGETGQTHLDINYSRFDGVQTLWVFEPEEQSEINLTFDSQVDSGKFKVVLITPEREVINIAEQNSKGSFKFATSDGKYTVKIVGNKANGVIRLERIGL